MGLRQSAYQAHAKENNWRLRLSWLTGRHSLGTSMDFRIGPLPILLGWLVLLMVLYLLSPQSYSKLDLTDCCPVVSGLARS